MPPHAVPISALHHLCVTPSSPVCHSSRLGEMSFAVHIDSPMSLLQETGQICLVIGSFILKSPTHADKHTEHHRNASRPSIWGGRAQTDILNLFLEMAEAGRGPQIKAAVWRETCRLSQATRRCRFLQPHLLPDLSLRL